MSFKLFLTNHFLASLISFIINVKNSPSFHPSMIILIPLLHLFSPLFSALLLPALPYIVSCITIPPIIFLAIFIPFFFATNYACPSFSFHTPTCKCSTHIDPFGDLLFSLP
jgi:hypothetical protein